MTEKKLQKDYQGTKFSLRHCEGAIESFNDALSHLDTHKRKSFERGIILQIQRLIDGHRMSKENYPSEGDLPKRKGQSKAKKFNALKRKPIRAYCWMSEHHPKKYFISHYVFKNYQKLKGKDTNIIGDNWKRIEVDYDEY